MTYFRVEWRFLKEIEKESGEYKELWKKVSGAIKAKTGIQSLRANKVSDMNLTQAHRPLTFSQKRLKGSA